MEWEKQGKGAILRQLGSGVRKGCSVVLMAVAPRGSCYTHIKVQVEATDGTGWALEASLSNLTPELTLEVMLTWLASGAAKSNLLTSITHERTSSWSGVGCTSLTRI